MHMSSGAHICWSRKWWHWHICVPVNPSSLFLSSLSLLSFIVLCETVHLRSRPQALRESPTSFSLAFVNISSTYNQLHIQETTWFLKLYDFTNLCHGPQRKNNILRPLLYVQIKFNGPAINHMTTAHCYNSIFHTEERKCRIFFFVWFFFFFVCGVEGYCILSAARQTLKRGRGEREKMCEGGWGKERLHPPSLANGLLSKSASQLEG